MTLTRTLALLLAMQAALVPTHAAEYAPSNLGAFPPVDLSPGLVASRTGVTYTASGVLAAPALAVDTLALVNCASACTMTLPDGVTDRQPYRIKRLGASVTIIGNIDSATGKSISEDSATILETLHLEWNAALGTWLTSA